MKMPAVFIKSYILYPIFSPSSLTTGADPEKNITLIHDWNVLERKAIS